MAVFNLTKKPIRQYGKPAHAGSWGVGGFRLPDIGVTEAFASTRTPQGGSNLINTQEAQTPPPFNDPNYYKNSVEGVANLERLRQEALNGRAMGTQPPGGTVTNTSGQPTNDQNVSQDVFEQAPQQPDFEQIYGSHFEQAYSALDQQIQARRQGLDVDISGIESKTASQKAGIEGRLGEAKQQLQSQREKQALEEQESSELLRRGFAEQQQGLQARHGRTTDTGRFASEILGREVFRLLNSNRQAFRQTENDIEFAKSSAISEANRQIFEADQESERLKRETKAQLDKDIADINEKRATLGLQRAKLTTEALTNYQSTISSINQRNTAFKQQLFRDQQSFERKLSEKRFDEAKAYNTRYEKELGRILDLAKSGSLTSAGLRQAEARLGFAGGSLQLPRRAEDSDKEKDINTIAGIKQ